MVRLLELIDQMHKHDDLVRELNRAGLAAALALAAADAAKSLAAGHGIPPRRDPPDEKVPSGEQSFRVWARHPAFMEDDKPWKCVAMFRFLVEALDYIAECQDQGVDVVFQSPAETKLVKHTDRRVVYRNEPVMA